MDGPWFRRYTPFILWPLNWRGWAALLLMNAVSLPCAYLWVSCNDSNPVLAWTGAAVGMAAIAGFHAVAFYKLERDYSGR